MLTSKMDAAAKDRFNNELLAVASRLEAAAASQRRHPHAKIKIPVVRIPPAPLGAAPMYTPSLDQWVQSSLGQIRTEKSGKSRARDLAALASALRRAAKPEGSTGAPQIDPAREAARVLAQKAYQTGGAGPAPNPKESLFQQILRWIGGLLDQLFRRVFGAAASVPIVGQIIAVVFVLLLAGALAYLVYALAKAIGLRRKTQRPDEGTLIQVNLDPQTLYQRGLSAAQAGRYAQAIALLFAASLASFEVAGKIELDASRTAGEYRRIVRGKLAAASPHFDAIAQAFVIAAFSERPVSSGDWVSADAAYRSLQPLLAS